MARSSAGSSASSGFRVGREWVALVDGNEHQLRLLRRKAKQHGVRLEAIVVDVIHVLEYVWKAGLALEGEGTTACERWVLERMQRILAGGEAPPCALLSDRAAPPRSGSRV